MKNKKPNEFKLNKEKFNFFKNWKYESPAYIFFEKDIKKNLLNLLKFKAPYGLNVRYAVKANPNISLLKYMDNLGLQFDCSTTNECFRVINSGINPQKILLTSQEVPEDNILKKLIKKGVNYNACSLLQLESYGRLFPNTNITIRINIGLGSGWNNRTSTGGLSSSFGIFDQFKEIDYLLEKYNLNFNRIHIHVGSGSDPEKQKESIIEILKVISRYKKIETLNVGGGFKISRTKSEKECNIKKHSDYISKELIKFYKKTDRKIKLEIEPGTYAIGNEVYIISKIIDIVNTGSDGFEFIKINSGMTDNPRISMYGAQHPLYIINNNNKKKKYIVVGSCCESGDILTCEDGNSEIFKEIIFTQAEVGDFLIIGGAGAYCSGMAMANYNSKQKSPEYFVTEKNKVICIREKESLNDVYKKEKLKKL